VNTPTARGSYRFSANSLKVNESKHLVALNDPMHREGPSVLNVEAKWKISLVSSCVVDRNGFRKITAQ
jgi:hypothetical protein